jgi:hypothetical protein
MLSNDYATRHTLSANMLFILPSIDKVHMPILLLLQNLVELIDANIVFKSHNRYWSKDESFDVPSVAMSIDV